jgi:N-terminal acetyltransferase B complex catalytic subunit
MMGYGTCFQILSQTFTVRNIHIHLSLHPTTLPRALAPRPSRLKTVIGKAEGHDTDWHGHITAVTVAPEYRRLAIAGNLCKLLEHTSEEPYRGFFVDLFVRRSNDVAIGMYERMGYTVYRCVRDYYANLGPGMAGSEDAYGQCHPPPCLVPHPHSPKRRTDMRKPLSRDPLRKSVRANGREIIVSASSVS